jgi:drug/metabolite transporter (DMT)-like permease
MQCTGNCKATNPKNRRYFEQPVIQTLQMFIGEMGCWLVIAAHSLYKRVQERRTKQSGYFSIPSSTDPLLVNNEEPDEDDEDAYSDDPLATSLTLTHDGRLTLGGWKVAYLAMPAICDILGTTLMNVGLLFVAASIYQMTRGALVLFVGLFSVWFLKRRLGLYKWFALFVVVSGVAVVGLAGALAKDKKATPSALLSMQEYLMAPVSDVSGLAEAAPIPELSVAVKTIIGISMIAGAQIFTATQFVIEERIMEKYSIEPLKAVGWEGIWGFLVTAIGMVVLHFAYGNTAAGKGGYFDMNEGLWEVMHYRAIAVSSVLIMISIG